MPREGTRSATGNSKPRVFQTVDTAPAIKRTTKSRVKKSPTASTKPGPKVKAAKPTGVTKKKSTAPKKDGVATKVSFLPFIMNSYVMYSFISPIIEILLMGWISIQSYYSRLSLHGS